MGVFSENAIIGASAAGGGYDIDNSLRFNSGDSAKLSRTPGSAGNRRTWTMSLWTKRSGPPADHAFLGVRDSSDDFLTRFGGGGLNLALYNGGSSPANNVLESDAVYRDPASWYHIVFAVDTTQAVNTNRCKMYVNGVQITDLNPSELNYPAINTEWQINSTTTHYLGADGSGSSMYYNGYLAEFYLIDGTQLTAADFGETDADTNEWKAIKYAGSYGTNGFFLEFKDSAALGADTSGNGNNWTVSNLAATDQMIDTPQNSTGGNFCTMNALYIDDDANKNITWTEGNLKWNSSGSGGDGGGLGTMSVSSSKWYWEYYVNTITGDNNYMGAAEDTVDGGGGNNFYYTSSTNSLRSTGETDQTGLTGVSNGDIVSVAIDLDASPPTGKMFLNNVQLGTTMDIVAGISWTPFLYNANTGSSKTFTLNCGQDSSFAGTKTAQGNTDTNDNGDFYYTPPSGYLALCTNNLPDPSIDLPTEHFETIVWTGTSSNPGAARTVTGLSFQPDFFFQGAGAGGGGSAHLTYDVLRGFGNDKEITTDSTKYEGEENADGYGYVSAVTSNGVTYSPGSRSYGDNVIYYDTTGAKYIRWNWKAGGTGVSNSDGTITSTVSVNTTAGISIVKYTGTSSNSDTVGHGLGVVPEMIIVKAYESGGHNWIVWTKDLTATTAYSLYLNDSGGQLNNVSYFYPTAPAATIFHPGDGGATNGSGTDTIAYCFNSIEGYSKVGTYKGNGDTGGDGPFILTNFSPAYVLIKRTDGGGSWAMLNNKSPGHNVINNSLYANDANAETVGAGVTSSIADFLSNGIKIRGYSSNVNNSSGTYVYIAFAENPFKTSNAR